MKTLIATFAVAAALFAHCEESTNEYMNVKVRDLPNGNVGLVGVDGVEQETVILDPEAFSSITNELRIIRDAINTDDRIREKLYGRVVKKRLDSEKKVMQYTHSSGFVYEKAMEAFKGEPKSPKITKPKTLRAEVKPSWMSDAQWSVRKERLRAKRGKKKVVNATFAPGGKVTSVEEVKE